MPPHNDSQSLMTLFGVKSVLYCVSRAPAAVASQLSVVRTLCHPACMVHAHTCTLDESTVTSCSGVYLSVCCRCGLIRSSVTDEQNEQQWRWHEGVGRGCYIPPILNPTFILTQVHLLIIISPLFATLAAEKNLPPASPCPRKS